MKTHELLSASESDYVQHLQTMKLKELERHANKILTSYGNGDYNELMRTAIRLLQSLEPNDAERFQKVQVIVNQRLAPGTTEDITQRLTVLVTIIITKKFHRIHNA